MKGLFAVLESIKVQDDSAFKEELVNTCTMLLASYKKYSHYAGSNSSIKIDSKYVKVDVDQKSDLYSVAEYEYLENLARVKTLLQDRFNLLDLSVINNDNFFTPIAILLPLSLSFFTRMKSRNADIVDVYEDSVIGTINLKTAKLSGDIANLKVSICFNLSIFLNYFNVNGSEFAALLLHEVGHLFSQLEQAYKITVVNNLISDIANDKNIKDSPDKVRLVLVKSIQTLDKNYVDNNSSMPVLTVSLFRKLVKSSRMANYSFSLNQEEEKLADLFAVRFGLGLEIASFLKQFEKYEYTTMVKYNSIFLDVDMTSYYVSIIRNIFLILSGLITLGLIFGVVAISTFAPIVAFIYITTVIMIVDSIFADKSINVKDVHPNTAERIEQVKKEYIRQLKVLDKDLDNSEHKVLIEAIDKLEEMYKSSLNKSLTNAKDMESKIHSLLDSGYYKRLDETQIEKILENLSNSDIYTDSAKLKILGE